MGLSAHLPHVQASWLSSDLVAGVTLAAYAIPVSLAYARLAGVPPQVGVYGYLMGGLGYALGGSSRFLAIGPTSAISLMIAGTVGDMAGDDATRYAQIATGAAIGVGLSCLLAWAFRLSVLVKLIRDSEITGAMNHALGSGFADDVATLIGRREPGNLYDAVVSSQFDADRLDYMQRDRLMTGVQSSAIDLTWLLANLEIASVRTGADEERAGEVETLVLGPKAVLTAESYVLSLFHLYPNVYFHKTTRAAEAVFGALLRRLIRLVRKGQNTKVGVPVGHPILRFAQEPEKLERALALDDLVFWGALPMLAEAEDTAIAERAIALRDRKLPECIDIRRMIEEATPRSDGGDRAQRQARLHLACTNIVTALRDWVASAPEEAEPVLIDRQRRAPYKRYQDSETPLNRILIRPGGTSVVDMAELSPVIAAAEPFEICRAYVNRGDTDTRSRVENIIRTETERTFHGNP